MANKIKDPVDVLDQKTPLKSLVIGVGNAGNVLLNLAHDAGYRTFAINTSYKDLKNSIVSPEIKSYIIGEEGKGAGKDREYAEQLFAENGKGLFKTQYFIDLCSDSDVIFVAGSTAGGTGSKIAPMILSLLKRIPQFDDKILIYMGILPKKSESLRAQINGIECVNDIITLRIPYILGDLEHFSSYPSNEAYTAMGEYLVDCLDIINGKYAHQSSHGMVDENDMRVTISEHGHLAIYNLDKLTQQSLDKEPAQKTMVKMIKNSPSAPIARDHKIKQMGIILNMPDTMSDVTRTGDYSELESYIGRPMATFENYSVTTGTTGQLIVILSGMSSPVSRLSEMQEIIDVDREKHLDDKVFDIGEFVDRNAVLNQPRKGWMKSKSPESIDVDSLFGDDSK